jgi:KDO2-lipid IV(A) lauroyltransferase
MSLAACLARGALRIGRVVPPGFAWRFGGMLGDLAGRLPLRDLRRAREHLARAFPERDRRWVRRTARRTFRHFGRMALWTIATAHRDPRDLRIGVGVEGRENLRGALLAHRRGEGTVGLSGHFGNWELLARLGGTLIPLTLVGRRLRDPDLDALVVGLRATALDSRIIYQDEGARPCLRALRDGRLLSTLPDQDVPRLAGTFVPWFGIPAWTPVGPAQLAVLGRAPVMPVFLYVRDGRWVIHWGPRLRWPTSGDRDADARAITAWVTAYEEALVRRHPEQWVWWHKRWRTRPAAVG